jgi:hypothetical protein
MSKSVLVLDTPKYCASCALRSGILHPFCRANRRDITDLSIRPDWCPLKPLPEKMTGVAQTDHWNSIKEGWNECIDEITGGNSDD